MALVVVLVIFAAVTTQAATGFGLGLVSMAFLTQILGIQSAAPLVALVAGLLELVLLVRYRHALNVGTVWRFSLGSAAGIPLGLYVLRHMDERLVLTVLGVLIVAYAVYALANPRLPELKHPGWAWCAGFFCGLLSAAYNTGGPPAVMYGHSRRWEPTEFKSNLQGFFLINGILVVAGHALSQHFTPIVWQNFILSIPALILGVGAGLLLERRINPATFRRIVLGLLILLGLRLIIRF